MGMGKTLSAILEEKNMTPNKLAELTGIPPMTIYSIIKRDNKKISIDKLVKICDVLKVDAERFWQAQREEWDEEAKKFAEGVSERQELLLSYLSHYYKKEEIGTVEELIENLQKLNKEGLLKAKERVEELSWVPNYQSPEYKAYLEAEKQKNPP